MKKSCLAPIEKHFFIAKVGKVCRWLALLPCLFLALQPTASWANNQELQLKAAYLVNIMKFVTWPESTSTVVFCISSKSNLAGFMSNLEGYKLNNARNLKTALDPTNIEHCNILFLDQGFSSTQINDIRSAGLPNLLIVSDMNNALKNGDTVQLFIRDLKLRIAINEQAVEKAGFTVSSKLLRLSRKLN